jgi:alpha-tubulin suppressor-like RCC1 family protein
MNQDRGIFLANVESKKDEGGGKKHMKVKAELYFWGRNTNNTLGCGAHNPSFAAPQKLDKAVIQMDTKTYDDPYEISTGANHTMVLCTGTEQEGKPDEKGKVRRVETGILYAMGLGSHGRLGVDRPAHITEDTWCTEEKAIPVKFEGAYRVISKDMADKAFPDVKMEGVYLYTKPDFETKDRKNLKVWGTNLHGSLVADGEWLKIEDEAGVRYLPMIDNSARVIFPVKVQVIRISCGSDHTIVLATTGVLYAWGLNNEGQCGVGTADAEVLKPTPIQSLLQDDIGHFACGTRHSMAVTGDGSLYAWGSNAQGRLGIGLTPSQNLPVRNTFVEGHCGFQYVACGEAHSGAIDTNEKVWTWGAGAHGRLGHGETTDVPTPQAVDVLEEVKCKMLALGAFHTVALTSGKPSKVYTWGMGHANGQTADGKSASFRLPVNTNLVIPGVEDDSLDAFHEVTQIACGAYHTMLLLRNGKVLTCGIGLGGRLGLAKPKDKGTKDYGTPQCIPKPCGFALKIKGDSTPMYFRRDSEKALAEKVVEERTADGKIKVAWDVDDIHCGSMHSAVLTAGGTVFIWGDCDHKQIGGGPYAADAPQWTPKHLHLAHQIKTMALGGDHCLVVTEGAGRIYAWGRGDLGQLGTGRQHDSAEPSLINPKFLGNGVVLAVAAGEDHNGAVVQMHETHSLFMWGNTENGKLGLGQGGPKTQPVPKELECNWDQKPGPDMKYPIDLACGVCHTAVIIGKERSKEGDTNGELWTFGGGLYGRLGVEEGQANYFEPAEVKELSAQRPTGVDVVKASCGAYHSAAILAKPEKNLEKQPCGELWVWGRNKMVCEPEHLLQPKKFNFIDESKFMFVKCGHSHTLCVMESGVLFAWGDNQYGQLGLDSEDKESPRPQQVRGLPGMAMGISVGPMHSMALLNNGEVWAWGNQSCGRLGLEKKNARVRVIAPKKVKAEWGSIEEITQTAQSQKRGGDDEEEAAAAGAAGGGDEPAEDDEGSRMLNSLESGQKVQQFATMQSLLKNEKPACKEAKLKELEDEITKEIQGYLSDIAEIPSKEKELLQLEADAAQGLGGITRLMKHAKAPELPAMLNPKVVAQHANYEELMWVLQQQPCYLASLSANISGSDAETLNKIMSSIFAELEDSRTVHLYMATLKLIMDKEITRSNELPGLFTQEVGSFVATSFAWFAMNPHHYQDVVWKFMDARSKTTLLWTILNKKDEKDVKPTDKSEEKYAPRDEYFAIDIKEFREEKGYTAKDATPEERQEFNGCLNDVKDFMTNGPFEKALKESLIHNDIRKVLNYAYQRLKARNFPSNAVAGAQPSSVPADLKLYEPLLSLVMHAILIPCLEDPVKYSGQKVGLPTTKLDEATGPNNIKVICKFFKEMMAGKYEPREGVPQTPDERQLSSIARQVKLSLLRYVKDLAAQPDDTETHTTIDVYASHYSRQYHTVSAETVDLLKMSNLLLQHQSKIRQTDDDPCVSTCQSIGEWPKEVIDEVCSEDSGQNVIENFVINSRFLLDKRNTNPEKQLVVCRTSSVPMPPRFCVGTPSLIKQCVMDQPDSMSKIIEDLFRDIDDIKANTWSDLLKELELQEKAAKAKNPPNFVLAHKITEGMKKVEELISVDFVPADLLNEMGDKLMQRQKHKDYLDQVQKGLHRIKKAKMEHAQAVSAAKTQMKQMAEFMTSLQLPGQIKEAAQEAGGGKLYLDGVRQQMVNLRYNRREKLTNCTFSPQATLPLPKLMKDNVVKSITESVATQRVYKQVEVTLALAMDGGLDLSIQRKQGKQTYMLSEFKLTANQLGQLKKAEEGTEMDLPNKDEMIIKVDPCKLSDLLGNITRGKMK